MSDGPTTVETAVVTELEEAAAAYRDAKSAVEDRGRDQLERLADAYETATNLLLEYEDSATDTGAREFVNFAQFKTSFIGLVEDLDNDLPAVDAFAAARDAIDKRRLSEDDFARARQRLGPVEDELEKLDALADARDTLVDARQRAKDRRSALTAEANRLDELLGLGAADFDAPVEELREPVDAYNDAVQTAFDEARRDAPIRQVFALLERAQAYPLVDFRDPPPSLTTFVKEQPAGEHSIAELLEFTEYSRSKLAHYVADPTAFRQAIATNRTYLAELDAQPLTIAWPPPPAGQVPWLIRELRAVADRLVDADAIAALRTIKSIARDEERYRTLRQTAIAEARLGADEQAALVDGTLAARLEAHRDAIDRIDDALAAAPDP
ncbi:MAG: hypothetical protein ACLFR6_06170 [Salinarchaeum sp.]